MKLSNYSPIFRQVLFREVNTEEKTSSSGLILKPGKDVFLKDHSSQFENERVIFDGSTVKVGDYVVVKAASDCLHVKTGDIVLLMEGARTIKVELEDGEYFQVMEQQIVGVSRA